MDTFTPYGWTHLIVVIVSVAAWVVAGRSIRPLMGTSRERIVRRVFGGSILAVNVPWAVYYVLPGHWDLFHSLPLHLCDFAWMAAAWSVLSGGNPKRLQHQLVFYWGFGLCPLGYLTPSLESGPASLHFWAFWIAHWQLLAAAFFNLFLCRVRPYWGGYLKTWAATAAVLLPVTLFNIAFNTSYFFTGDSTPANPTPLDILGPWPLRLVWMILIVSALFAAMTVPWRRQVGAD